MALDPFGTEPGLASGRIQPVGWAPPEGLWVFSLGHDTPGVKHKFNIGDRVEAFQTADFAGATLARVRAKLRPPAAITPGAYWAFSVLVDDVEKYRMTMKDTRSRDLNDIAVNVAGLTGARKLALRLTLVNA